MHKCEPCPRTCWDNLLQATLSLLFGVDWFLFAKKFLNPWHTARFLCQTSSDPRQVMSTCSSAQLKGVRNYVSIKILLNYILVSVNTNIENLCWAQWCTFPSFSHFATAMFLYSDICYCTSVHPSVAYFSKLLKWATKESHHPNKSGLWAEVCQYDASLTAPCSAGPVSNQHLHLWCGNTWNSREANVTPLWYQITFKRLSKLAEAIVLNECQNDQLKSQLRHQYPTVFNFLQSLQINVWIVPQTRQWLLLPCPFQFVIHAHPLIQHSIVWANVSVVK